MLRALFAGRQLARPTRRLALASSSRRWLSTPSPSSSNEPPNKVPKGFEGFFKQSTSESKPDPPPERDLPRPPRPPPSNNQYQFEFNPLTILPAMFGAYLAYQLLSGDRSPTKQT